MARKKIVAGNWKMNQNINEGRSLITEILNQTVSLGDNVQVVIAPPYIHLESASSLLKGKDGYLLAAQNCHQEPSGAYTGEVSVNMLKSVGVTYVILGHSERRQYFNEDSALLAAKTNTALAEGLHVIFCCGEPLEIREANTQNDFVKKQLSEGLFHLTSEQMASVVIAYEPIWAIGTGRTASADQAQEMHQFIRKVIAEKYGDAVASNTTILYGGSCNAKNASELFACPDVDGGLIGGASLKAADFCTIIAAR